ncbi:hypothetical protein [Streptomyces sp. NBC_00154]|uniref:hypothetical protein n=1 Tax=Streptomyces sp. NBC_00154 TaxID=2975670 RepID=UPI0022545F14|nr:hypothetical protein [Streptomyces sp. NBC_00154]MCX5318065.1 hypothetical protein [Streptomyces sp. NBC_00154]
MVRTTFGGRATEPQPLAAGAWSQAFELTIDDVEVVLRIGAHGTDFAKDELAARFAGPNLPVPPVLARGMVDAWQYAISARAHGTGFDDLSASDVRVPVTTVSPILLAYSVPSGADGSLARTVAAVLAFPVAGGVWNSSTGPVPAGDASHLARLGLSLAA